MNDERADAWISWSALAEPADGLACALVAALGPQEALAWLRGAVAHPRGAGGALIERVGDELESSILARLVEAAPRWAGRLDRAEAHVHRDHAARVGARILTPGDEAFPGALRDLGPAMPHALYVRGEADVAAMLADGIAVVGSRACTSYGSHVAAELSAAAIDRGRATVSGGAYGIDVVAHRAALAAGGPTLAVMAGGVDRWYPAGNSALLDAVCASGAVISEVPPGWAPHRSRFLTRNRLIATAAATVVVEAAHRSGALSTARHAAQLSRPVAAVPGPVTSAASGGCHRLIRDGVAVIATRFAEIDELCAPLEATREEGLEGESEGAGSFGSPGERAAFDAVGVRGATSSEVRIAAGLSPAEARRALARLQAQGQVVCADGRWNRVSKVRRTS